MPPPDSKKLCGNVAADQPDLVGLDVWPAAIALCTYLAAHPALAAGAAVCELGAGAHMCFEGVGWSGVRACGAVRAWRWPWLVISPRVPADTYPDAPHAYPTLWRQAWACRACCAPSLVPPRCC